WRESGVRKRTTTTGVRNEFRVLSGNKAQPTEMLIGGGYVESYGYDSNEPTDDSNKPTDVKSKDGLWNVRLKSNKSIKHMFTGNKRYRFSLSDVIGMSGAAPSITIEEKGIHPTVFPHFRYWAIDREKVLGDKDLRNKDKELIHGDGGDIDNLALMPLLTRKVDNILVFINTRTPFPENADCSR
ncbi:MAG: hypothetical protein GY706_12650, partial [Bacteroides sp.]|nr:hypothetical protein [Bacteroides sp.]